MKLLIDKKDKSRKKLSNLTKFDNKDNVQEEEKNLHQYHVIIAVIKVKMKVKY